MRRRRLILLLAGCALTAILVALLWTRDREPEYQGKFLSQWLAQYRDHDVEDGAAAAGVREIGTKALPWLLKWLRYERAPWRGKLLSAVNKLPAVLSKSSIAENLRSDEWVHHR